MIAGKLGAGARGSSSPRAVVRLGIRVVDGGESAEVGVSKGAAAVSIGAYRISHHGAGWSSLRLDGRAGCLAILAIVVEHEELVLDNRPVQRNSGLVHVFTGLDSTGNDRTRGIGSGHLVGKLPRVQRGVAEVLIDCAVVAVSALLDRVVLNALAAILSAPAGRKHLELADSIDANRRPDETRIAHGLRRGHVDAVNVHLFRAGRRTAAVDNAGSLRAVVAANPVVLHSGHQVLKIGRTPLIRSSRAALPHLQRKVGVHHILHRAAQDRIRCGQVRRRGGHLDRLARGPNREFDIQRYGFESIDVQILLNELLKPGRRHRNDIRARRQRSNVVIARAGRGTGDGRVRVDVGRRYDRADHYRAGRILHVAGDGSGSGKLRMRHAASQARQC